MNWAHDIGVQEWVMMALFFLAYGLFLWRHYRIRRKLRSKGYSVYIKVGLRVLAFAAIIGALLGPSFGETKREVREQGKDILILVDLSESMMCRDVQPSRLDRTKAAVDQLVRTFKADRIGLIVFSSVAYIQCPLTYDYNALLLFANTLKTDQVPDEGTDFGAALQLAYEKHQSATKLKGRDQSKVVVMISDGEDFGEETDAAVQNLQKAGIKVLALGIGTREGGPIPFRGGLMMDAENQRVITKLKSRDLKSIASATGGEYFEVNETLNQVPRLIAALDRIEGQVREIRKVDVGADKYYYFVIVALALVVADILFTIKVIRI